MQKPEQLILPLVLISVLAIKAGHALDCYTCDSSLEPECTDIKKSTTMKLVTCKPSELGQNVGDWLKELTRIDFYETSEVNVPMVCQKIIAKDEQNKLVTFRGCQLDGGKTDVCETVKKKGGSISIEFCEVCKEDGCNGSSTPFTKLWLLLIPMVLVKNWF